MPKRIRLKVEVGIGRGEDGYKVGSRLYVWQLADETARSVWFHRRPPLAEVCVARYNHSFAEHKVCFEVDIHWLDSGSFMITWLSTRSFLFLSPFRGLDVVSA